MANTKAKRHTHKYFKAREFPKSPSFLWACALPDCNHHMPKHMESMLPGKYTMCWKCGETTIMDERTMKMDKPLCDDCDPETSIENTVNALTELGLVDKVTGE